MNFSIAQAEETITGFRLSTEDDCWTPII